MSTGNQQTSSQAKSWLDAVRPKLVEETPDAPLLFDKRAFMETLHPLQRQSIWFFIHDAFHQSHHDNRFEEASRFAESVFADLHVDHEAPDFQARIVAHAVRDSQLQFAYRLAITTSDPEYLAEPYENAIRWTQADYSPSPDEENAMARQYANREMFKAFGDVTRFTSTHSEADLFPYREHFHAFILQRVANAIENNNLHFDQAHTEDLCQSAIACAQRLVRLLQGHTIYETPELEPPEIPPRLTTARTHTECLDAILEAVPAIRVDWPEFVTNTRTAATLSDRSDLQSEAAHGLLTILHRMVWPCA